MIGKAISVSFLDCFKICQEMCISDAFESLEETQKSFSDLEMNYLEWNLPKSWCSFKMIVELIQNINSNIKTAAKYARTKLIKY